MSGNVIDCHLPNITACDISKNRYFEHAKTATVRLLKKIIGQKLKTTALQVF